MKSVNVYTWSGIRGMKKRDGHVWYILETETNKGPATVGDKLKLEQCTENEAELTVLETALQRMRTPAEVHIYTESRYIAAAWNQEWLRKWQENDWKNAKGEEIAHADKWKAVSECSSRHNIIIHLKEKHSYKEWMEAEARRANG